jgi:hypothetical protein
MKSCEILRSSLHLLKSRMMALLLPANDSWWSFSSAESQGCWMVYSPPSPANDSWIELLYPAKSKAWVYSLPATGSWQNVFVLLLMGGSTLSQPNDSFHHLPLSILWHIIAWCSPHLVFLVLFLDSSSPVFL